MGRDTRENKPSLPVWTVSLGCPKNRVDTERLLGSLGIGISPAKSMAKSRLVLINTCGFIEPAVRESIDAILDSAAAIKRLRRKPLLAVAGCMVGRYGVEELSRELPEVDLWLPSGEIRRWPAILRGALGLAGLPASPGRLLSTGPGYAWLKIGEGCSHKCSFCTIPAIRGPAVSTPAGQIAAEAEMLLSQGVREISLVAQDVSQWGRDLPGSPSLPRLLERLLPLEGLKWLRLLYLYPGGIGRELLTFMRDAGPPLLPYLDIPIQHAHPEILRGMGRPFAGDPRKLIGLVRHVLPHAALRTSLIVGYPGETDAHFQALCDFVEETGFQNLGVFAYQAEEGTPAARLPGQLPKSVREERRRVLMAIQAEISRKFLASQLGRELDVLVGEPLQEWPGLHAGRVWFQAPEIDGMTYVSGPGISPGALVKCDIIENGDYDLTALA